MANNPIYLQEQTEDEIMQRMLNRVPSDIDKSEGSFIWDAQAPVAFMLSEAAIWAQQVVERGFARTTFGEYLDMRVEEHGVQRRQAIAATGSVRFTGTSGKQIPSGTVVATPADEITGESSIEYKTTEEVILGSAGEGIAPVIALIPGKTGNVPAGVIDIVSNPISGVSAVTNPGTITGGADIESDESLLERFYTRVRNQGTSGNKAQYVQWANEVAGVGGVQVIPLWNGPGTVGIYLLDMDKRAASPAIVRAAQDYIDPTMDGQGEGQAPAGPIVTAMAADEVPINISVQLTLASGYQVTRKPRVQSTIEAENLTINTGYGGSVDDTQEGPSGGKCVKFTYVTNGNSKATISGETLANILVKAGQYKIRARVKVSDTSSATQFFVLSVQNPQTNIPFEQHKGSGTPTDEQLMFSPNQIGTDWTWVELPFYWDGIQPVEIWTGRPFSLIEGVILWEDSVELVSDDKITTVPSEIQKQIEEGVTIYLKSLAFKDPLVRFTRIAAVLLDIPPIIDYSDLTVNGQSDTNIQINPGQVAVLGTVTLNA